MLAGASSKMIKGGVASFSYGPCDYRDSYPDCSLLQPGTLLLLGFLSCDSALAPPGQPRKSTQRVHPLAPSYLAFHPAKGPLPVIHTLPRETIVVNLQNPLSVYTGPAGYFVLGSLSCRYLPMSN